MAQVSTCTNELNFMVVFFDKEQKNSANIELTNVTEFPFEFQLFTFLLTYVCVSRARRQFKLSVLLRRISP